VYRPLVRIEPLNLDSRWKQSILETGNILAALIVRNLLQQGITENALIVVIGEVVILVPVLGIAVLLKKISDTAYRNYRRIVFKGLRWFIGPLAGLLFATAFSLFILYPLFGVVFGAAAFGLVASVITYAKSVEEPTKPKSNKFGLTKETTGELLQQLFTKRAELQEQYDALRTKNPGIVESLEMIGIRQQREAIDRKVSDIRDWYGLRVFEGLEEESRTLKWLTVALIVLTTVLAIFTGFLVLGMRLP